MNRIKWFLRLIKVTHGAASSHFGGADGQGSIRVRIMAIDAHGHTVADRFWSQGVSLIEPNRCLLPMALIARFGEFHGERSGVGNGDLGVWIPNDADVAVGTLDTLRGVFG